MHLISHIVVPSQASLIFVKNRGVVGQYFAVTKLPACSEHKPKFRRPQKAEMMEMCLYSLHLNHAVSSSHFTVPFCKEINKTCLRSGPGMLNQQAAQVVEIAVNIFFIFTGRCFIADLLRTVQASLY